MRAQKGTCTRFVRLEFVVVRVTYVRNNLLLDLLRERDDLHEYREVYLRTG